MIKILKESTYWDLIERKTIAENYVKELEEIITNLQDTIVELNEKIKKQQKELRNGRTKWK